MEYSCGRSSYPVTFQRHLLKKELKKFEWLATLAGAVPVIFGFFPRNLRACLSTGSCLHFMSDPLNKGFVQKNLQEPSGFVSFWIQNHKLFT